MLASRCQQHSLECRKRYTERLSVQYLLENVNEAHRLFGSSVFDEPSRAVSAGLPSSETTTTTTHDCLIEDWWDKVDRVPATGRGLGQHRRAIAAINEASPVFKMR
jgi:hypothetical protein